MVRPVRTAIDVVLVATSPDVSPEVSDLTQPRLEAALADQGVATSVPVRLVEADPQRLRERLAALLTPAGVIDLPPIAVIAADLVVNAPPLGAVLDDERVATGALALVDGSHATHLGVLRIDAADRVTAAASLREMKTGDDVLLGLTRALADRGVAVRPVPLGGYAWARPASPAEAGEALAGADAVDERTVRLREAARGGDGFYSTFVLRRLSWRFTGVAERTGLTPNQVTLLSFAIGLLGAGLLAIGDRGWSVAGALLLQLCLVVDCVDGELARYRRRFSRFGAWLDATTDRIKEFAAVAALGYAAHRHGDDLWGLVAAAIALQTFRNLLDLGWALLRAAGPQPVPAPSEWIAPVSRSRAASPDRPRAGALSWARRVGHFPVGERFLLLSLGAAFWSPEGTLLLLLGAGLLSATYMLAAFAVRSRPAAGPGRPGISLLDSGPLLGELLNRVAGRRPGRFGAVLPAVLAVGELALIWWLAAGVAGAGGGATTTLLAVTAVAHYQHAYGVREDSVSGGGFVVGTDLRLLALALVVAVPAAVLDEPDAGSWARSTVLALAVLVAFSSTARSLQGWTRPPGGGHLDGAPAGRVDGEEPLKQGPASIDRMDTVNAGTDGTVLRQEIGGDR